MDSDLQRDLMDALERPHRLGTIGGNLEEQLAHCASFSSVLGRIVRADATTAIDLGTGGGLPGLALAALWPQLKWTLVDMRVARATEVERSALRLGLGARVRVIGSDAQAVGHDVDERERYDVAVARAFGPASVTAECAAGVVRVGGVFVVSEPPEVDTKRWNVDGLRCFGFGAPVFHEHGGARFAELAKIDAVDASIPRLPPRSSRGWINSD